MSAHTEPRRHPHLTVAAAQGRTEWLSARTRTECDALLRRVLSWDQRAAPKRLEHVRQTMSATLAGLQADLLRHARSKTPGAGLRGPTGPGVPGPNVLDRYPRVRPGPDRAGLGTLLGWLYVVEGMRLHLHVLESMERRASGLPPDSAGNASVLARWNMVVAAVEKAPLAGSDLADLLAGAHDALRCLSTDLDSDGA